MPTGRRLIARALVSCLLGSAAATAAAVAAPTAAFAESSYQMESEFIAKMNSARQANGLAPYAVYSDLTSIARQHSQQMASRQELYHNPNLTTEVQNWQAVGENVGDGPTVDSIHQAFMNSPEHRANILDHDFTQVGVGVTVDKNGTIWVTEDFREPMHSSSSAPVQHVSHSTSSPPSHSLSSYPHTGTTAAPAAPTAAEVRAHLLTRLRAAQRHAARLQSVDPVAQAFDFFHTVSGLTG